MAALATSQPLMNASPVGRGRSLCTTSAIAGSTVNGESATTIASAVISPSTLLLQAISVHPPSPGDGHRTEIAVWHSRYGVVVSSTHRGGGFNPVEPTSKGGPDYGRFIAAVRDLQDHARAVDAPDGTAARPRAPEARTMSTSTVGLPRLS